MTEPPPLCRCFFCSVNKFQDKGVFVKLKKHEHANKKHIRYHKDKKVLQFDIYRFLCRFISFVLYGKFTFGTEEKKAEEMVQDDKQADIAMQDP
jgi:hypothetical protein